MKINKQNIKGNNNQQAGGNITNIDVQVNDSEFLLNKLPSKMAKILPLVSKAISQYDKDNENNMQKYKTYSIEGKINYNDLKKYKLIVQKYGQYRLAVEGTYESFDNENPGAKRRILGRMNFLYDLEKGKIIASLTDPSDEEIFRAIRKNSDDIIDRIHVDLQNKLREAEEEIEQEDLEAPLAVLICHAFIECKILEEPPDDYT